DSRRLAEADIALIEPWVAAGAPEGDRRDLPSPREFPRTWTLGPPDLELDPGVDFSVSSRDDDLYRCFTIPTRFAEERWVTGVEVIPGNRRIVHHVLTSSTPRGPQSPSTTRTPAPATRASGDRDSPPRAAWAAGRRERGPT